VNGNGSGKVGVPGVVTGAAPRTGDGWTVKDLMLVQIYAAIWDSCCGRYVLEVYGVEMMHIGRSLGGQHCF
jgi:hypothetical protein